MGGVTLNIKITPEEVRSVAAQFKDSSAQSDQMVQKLNTTMKNLQQNWAGASSQHFYQQFEQWTTTMKQFVTLLDDINKQLLQVADRFEQADKPA